MKLQFLFLRMECKKEVTEIRIKKEKEFCSCTTLAGPERAQYIFESSILSKGNSLKFVSM